MVTRQNTSSKWNSSIWKFSFQRTTFLMVSLVSENNYQSFRKDNQFNKINMSLRYLNVHIKSIIRIFFWGGGGQQREHFPKKTHLDETYIFYVLKKMIRGGGHGPWPPSGYASEEHGNHFNHLFLYFSSIVSYTRSKIFLIRL